jgi:hypothetical protein
MGRAPAIPIIYSGAKRRRSAARPRVKLDQLNPAIRFIKRGNEELDSRLNHAGMTHLV